jgi:hypothetical protein
MDAWCFYKRASYSGYTTGWHWLFRWRPPSSKLLARLPGGQAVEQHVALAAKWMNEWMPRACLCCCIKLPGHAGKAESLGQAVSVARHA